MLRILEASEQEEQGAHAKQGEADDHHSGDSAATQRDLQSLAEAGTRGTSGANIGPDGDEHAGVAGEAGTDGADQKADDHFARQWRGKVGKLVPHKEGNGQHYGQRGDAGVLARHKRFRALADGVRDRPHFRRAGVVGEDRFSKKEGKNQAEQTGNQSDP